MNVLAQVVAELRHRRVHAALVIAGLAIAVATAVGLGTLSAASSRETARIMRDLGYNLRIVPRGTDHAALWRDGHSDRTMPADGVRRFAEQTVVAYNHLLAMLHRRVEIAGGVVLLTGITREISPEGKPTGTMLFEVERGTVHLGAAAALLLGAERDGSVELQGRSFSVAAVLAPAGTDDDLRAYLHLGDAQDVLGLPGAINEIKALECACASPGPDPRARLQAELERILPAAEVIRVEAMADARKRQRRMADDWFALLSPAALAASGLWVCFLFVLNVRERRSEIGTLRALGHGSGRIATLFLAKAIILGVAGGLVGFTAGTALALSLGPGVFPETASALAVPWLALPAAILLAPLFAALASFAPAMLAVAADPAESLRDPR